MPTSASSTSRSPHREEILNVFRESDKPTLTVQDLVPEFSVGERAMQNHVNELHEDGYLVLETDGRPNHWRLADSEPQEPVYRTELATAKRWGRQSVAFGQSVFMIAISVMAAGGLVMSYHVFARGMAIRIPVVQDVSAAVTAAWAGVLSSLLPLVGSVAYAAGLALPRVIEWRLEETLPDEL
ncbi:hypothetical protein [Salinigranum marinum]|uniref:hypothetical protein n=1 Tax=Salinigranum marinum TaxID=1515595 RepID=UPI00298A05E2|nr:hypothetical protein [Salinigranum marinum]